MASPIPYPGQVISFASTYGTRPDAKQSGLGPSVCPLVFKFTGGQFGKSITQVFQVSLQGIFPFGLSNIQTIYIDNSKSAVPIQIDFPVSGESIVAEPFTRGWYPCITNTLTFTVTGSPFAATVVNIEVYNFIIPPLVINATELVLGSNDEVVPSRVATGNTFGSILLAAGGNQSLGLGGPFVPNPYYYITGWDITYSFDGGGGKCTWIVTIYNATDAAGINVDRIFWNGVMTVPGATAVNGILTMQQGLNLTAAGFLFIKAVGSAAAGGTNFLEVNIYGGTTGVAT